MYVVGNQRNFDTKLCYVNDPNKVVRYISVPEFYKTYSIVLMDISTLETFEFKLDYSIIKN